jgi:extracellular factor (EF) 3-hydroxypalmitic acid methyl ester biosynthesis protein
MMQAATAIATDARATFQTSQGLELRGSVVHLARHSASVEVYSPEPVIRSSEVLQDFCVVMGEDPVYRGRALVQHQVNTGSVTVCSVALDDTSFDAEYLARQNHGQPLGERFAGFMAQWGQTWRVLPEFKVAVADIQTLLLDLRLWMAQIELGLQAGAPPDLAARERDAADQLSPVVVPVLNSVFERFERQYRRLTPEECPEHRSYVQRHLHPLVLCAPFAYRSYVKPLGYAGDYEMVDMMLRDPREGASLFAKVFNVWLLQQDSAAAHRNRIEYLTRKLVETVAPAERAGRRARILNLGCGPAREIQYFMARSALSDWAEFTLLDFNEETLRHAQAALEREQRRHSRSTLIQVQKKSVQQLLKDALRAAPTPQGANYDLIYCAGLFDYLDDRTCRRLLSFFHQLAAPGGRVLATNVAPSTPNRGSLELILDWHLIYRDAAQVERLCPETIPADSVRVESEATGQNIFLEICKDDAR